VIACKCNSIRTRGFKNVNGWWVCNKCELPTTLYLIAMTEKGFSMGLVYFEGGPLDGRAYESKSLLGGQGLLPEVGEYNWTSDKKVSGETGAVAQIWRWKNDNGSNVPSAPAPEEAELAAAVFAANVPEQPDAITTAIAKAGSGTPIVTAPQPRNGAVSNMAAPKYDEKPKAPRAKPATGDVPEGQDGETLRRRREALKIPRGKFSDMIGYSAARVDRVERELGNKPMLEERQLMWDKLNELEGASAGAH
jgi:hypothetical protein